MDQPSKSWCARPPHPCPRRPAAAHAVAGVGCVSYRLVACHRSLVHGSKERMSQTWYPHGKWRQQSPAAAAAHPWPEPQRGGDAARRTPEAAKKSEALRCYGACGKQARRREGAEGAAGPAGPPGPPHPGSIWQPAAAWRRSGLRRFARIAKSQRSSGRGSYTLDFLQFVIYEPLYEDFVQFV